MNFYLSVPFLFFKFWYLEAPVKLVNYFFSVNHVALQVLSLPLMVRTFFKPLKNEYRKGLIGFSIGMGVLVKSILILFDLFALGFILLIEILSLIFFLFWPLLAIIILFV